MVSVPWIVDHANQATTLKKATIMAPISNSLKASARDIVRTCQCGVRDEAARRPTGFRRP